MSSPLLPARRLPATAPACVLACGAWLRNSACLLDGDTVWQSPVHGDLGSPDSRAALVESVSRLRAVARHPIQAVAHDLHPDFFSTELALRLARELDVPAIAVQHHHAHIARIQAERASAGPLIGIALDGLGLGTDHTAWGGEVLWVGGGHFERLAHLPPLQLPGGDAAAREPWRMAAAVLHRLGRTDEIPIYMANRNLRLQFPTVGPSTAVSETSARTIRDMLRGNLNCPSTTSAGRWFDAAAGILGVCRWQAREAQAAMALESLATEWLSHHPVPVLDDKLASAGLNLDILMGRLLDLVEMAEEFGDCGFQAEGAALFHIALAQALAHAAIAAAKTRQVSGVALGGGCFANQLLRQHLAQLVSDAGLEVLTPADMNVGDAGLALGQAWVAAHHVHQPTAVALAT